MRTVVVGNRKLARYLLHRLLDAGWNIVGVLTPKGQLASEQANYTSFRDLIEDKPCELYTTADINSSETKRWLKSVNPDICLCGGWSQIIDEEVLNVPDDGFIGFHSSNLPAGRGGAPVNWSIIRGADEIGISMFYYDSGVDAGDIIAQSSVPVERRDNVKTIFDAIASKACELVLSVRSDLSEGSVEAETQSIEEATYRPRRQPQDGLILWDRDSKAIDSWVRGLTSPYPGAYTFFAGNRVTVWRGKPVDGLSATAKPGEIIRIVDGKGVDVQTGSGCFRLTRVQVGEGPSRWADRLASDIGLQVGDQFGQDMAPSGWQYTGLRRLLRPASFDTNLQTNDTGKLNLLILTSSREELRTRVSAGAELVLDKPVSVDGTYDEQVQYSFSQPGTYTISAEFEIDRETVDTRYLKVFVHE